MTSTRRRGAELQRAIEDAVLADVREHGYAGATYERIAARAGTSKAVLYRRWPSKAEMIVAATTSTRSRDLIPAPDTGSLAGDLRSLLRTMRALVGETNRATLLSLMAELDASAGESLRVLLFSQVGELLQPSIERARTRGELGATPLAPRALSLPFDLARHEFLVVGALTDAALDSIVDDVVVPLLVTSSRRPQPADADPAGG
ncbi:TetR/AcrR family transcriptional regulator [Modestobacter roseus]|uniref:TetR family transcriptional regulator n=1 Tax=Modestobacter roseus TaxID=1181884 RepID=A0A562IM09_9ACTN|nr:TetR/AcrR family transcriptional regulator [Modestobacter roseus]MQA33768.1 TetR family transcriptional regulator [Modestobacter roseus]TWH72047.1 TetR family transcriptional regulator [Modestobacter roseus]